MRWTMVLVVVLIGGLHLFGQCPNCPVPASAAQVTVDAHGWYKGSGDKLDFYWRGEFTGSLDPVSGVWITAGKTKPLDLIEHFGLGTGRLGFKPSKECVCKDGECNCAKCPEGCVAKSLAFGGVPNMGMAWESNGRETFTKNGHAVTQAKMLATLSGAGDVPDDAATPRLLLLSKNASLRKSVLADFDGSKWKGKAIVQAYDPGDWAIQRPDGQPLYTMPIDPTVYCMDGDGKQRGHASGYAGPADLDKYLAAASKLRDPVPGVDPLKSPDLNAPVAKPKAPGGAPVPVSLGGLLTVGFAGLVTLILAAKKKG